MPPQPPKKSTPTPTAPAPTPAQHAPRPVMAPVAPAAAPGGDVNLGVAVSASSDSVTVTARKGGGVLDMSLDVDPEHAGVRAALQHLAKAVNIAFQTDYGENYLESVYQAAVVLKGEIRIIHREYFGFQPTWFGQFGRLLRSLQLT